MPAPLDALSAGARSGTRAIVLELAAPGVAPPVAGDTVSFHPRAAGDLEEALVDLAAAVAWLGLGLV